MRPAALLVIAATVALPLFAACGGGSEIETESTATPTVRASRTPAATATAAPAAQTQAPIAAPTDTPAPVQQEQQPTQQPPANSPPEFPSNFQWTGGTEFEYDDVGRLIGAVTTFTIPAASDPDGDPLTYTWSASNGSITGSGLTATWTNEIEFGQPKPGTVTVTVSDGRGGSDSFTIEST